MLSKCQICLSSKHADNWEGKKQPIQVHDFLRSVCTFWLYISVLSIILFFLSNSFLNLFWRYWCWKCQSEHFQVIVGFALYEYSSSVFLSSFPSLLSSFTYVIWEHFDESSCRWLHDFFVIKIPIAHRGGDEGVLLKAWKKLLWV